MRTRGTRQLRPAGWCACVACRGPRRGGENRCAFPRPGKECLRDSSLHYISNLPFAAVTCKAVVSGELLQRWTIGFLDRTLGTRMSHPICPGPGGVWRWLHGWCRLETVM